MMANMSNISADLEGRAVKEKTQGVWLKGQDLDSGQRQGVCGPPGS